MASKRSCTASCCDCGGESEACKSLRCVDRKKDKGAAAPLRKFDLGPLPSPSEVDDAVAALQSFLQGIFSYESTPKWLQPLLDGYGSMILHSEGYQCVCKAFKWLQTDPSFKRLVVSLCLDKAVWNAIINNEIVGKLQELPFSGGNGKPEGFEEGPDLGRTILRWVLDMALTKIVELVQSFLVLVNDTFHFRGREKLKPENRDQIEEKVQASVVLSLVVLLIVVVARAQIS